MESKTHVETTTGGSTSQALVGFPTTEFSYRTGNTGSDGRSHVHAPTIEVCSLLVMFSSNDVYSPFRGINAGNFVCTERNSPTESEANQTARSLV